MLRFFKRRILAVFPFLAIILCLLGMGRVPINGMISIHGAVKNPSIISLNELKKMPSFHMNDVALLKEKKHHDDPEELLCKASYRGVLLRDILERAGMEYRRKWEPGVYVRVRGSENRDAVFSFGEIFYSSIGRSILLAYEKDGKPIPFAEGCGELIVATDIRDGRRICGIKEIIVERVGVKLEAYKDAKKKTVRPPTSSLSLVNTRDGKSMELKLEDIKELPSVYINAAVMVGDCEGFGGMFSFEGAPLNLLLKKIGIDWWGLAYDQYVVVSSADGFCATFSLGEIFNSRLGDNIVIAYKKNGEFLGPHDGFALSVVREDSTGGRSVKRIEKIEVF